ncbi:MAG: hypothetical protein HQ478_05735 [Chloroflexi bacterium]|nr:hypothetical protein [Chloroflexota bacterium]
MTGLIQSRLFAWSENGLLRWLIYAAAVTLFGLAGFALGFNADQVQSFTVFGMIVMGALMFWRFRLAFALGGLGLLLLLGLTNVPNIVEFAGIEIILFLIGMMILIGFLEEQHFFERVVDAITGLVGPNPRRLTVVLMVMSAISAALVDEVTSIMFMATTVFQVSKRYGVNPIPLLIMVVVATNIGSAATVVGNPVGVMIALRSGLGFTDFLRWATPVAVAGLVIAIPIMMWQSRDWLNELRSAMQGETGEGQNSQPSLMASVLSPEMRLPWGLFIGTIVSLVLHTQIEKLLGLEKNTMLLGTALIAGGIVLALARDNARELVEKRVEWWSLTFFVLLFASVGTLSLTGATSVFANRLVDATGGDPTGLFLAFVWVAGLASALMDNVLAIATLIPVVQELETIGADVTPLWWGMLFGGTFFGNLTMIGSTANIVAIGMLERRQLGHVTMVHWVKSTALVSVTTLALATLMLGFQLVW